MDDQLILKTVNELLGDHFYIPHYQRGYRWTAQQVKDLLDDIWAFSIKSKPNNQTKEFYCLQPVVVKKKQWTENNDEITGWELIDGQQRLTTLYIIISYLTKEFLKTESLQDDYGKQIFTLCYETRPKSEEFLRNIIADNSNIDFYHISSAYQTVADWFASGLYVKDRTDKNKFLGTLLGKREDDLSVQVIWYQVEKEANSIELFTRLNIGKIPLTNSELIKALFLSSSSFEKESHDNAVRKKLEISQIWDEIEHSLTDEYFWSFATNAKQKDYSTKIELLLDSKANKKKTEIDPLFTFLYFLKESKNNNDSLWNLWLSVENYYLTLRQWIKDKNLYHKVGYLITSGESMGELINMSMDLKKDMFESVLDKKIADSVKFEIDDLSYQKNGDYKKIENVLLLFNIESIRSNKYIAEFYPFKFYKNIQWSLEHIHAQNSDSLDKSKKELWFSWLSYHERLIEDLAMDSHEASHQEWAQLLQEVRHYNNERLTWERFTLLAKRIISVFSEGSDIASYDPHSISNLALLSHPDNAALNNSVFEVKRRDVIRMDKEGAYIPLCTRRVFLKYYNDKPSNQQLFFWGANDRENYVLEIKKVLKNYLPHIILNANLS